jgi:hypothetical protein
MAETVRHKAMTENQLVTNALQYAKNGFLVFPLHTVKDGKCTCRKDDCDSPAKHPRTAHGLKQASKDSNLVKNLFSSFNYLSANIAVCTGKESNLVVVDVDCAKGGRIEELYNFISKEILEKTLWSKTGGGYHLYFRYPQNAEIRNSTSKLGNKIDVRGEGGYIVAPPSLHISGNRYEFLNDNSVKPFPQAFIEKLNKTEARTENNFSNGNTLQKDFYLDGNRNNSLTSVAGKLRRAGLSENELEPTLIKINSERCKPPLSEKEVLQIVSSVSRYDVQTQPQNKFDLETNNGNFPSLFTIQGANIWMENSKLRPVPKMLFGEFWFEGELCILFADTGKGKSILAVQIADSISKGLNIRNFKLEAKRQNVLYFDFELSDKQFEARYSIKQGDYFANHYAFDGNFKRGEINQNSFAPDRFKDFQEYLNFSLEYEIVQTEAKVLIVDNITYLKNATETAKDALPLMKELIRLKKKYDLSILALAHTPKRDLSRPITVNDLQGSKMLSNFSDSIFAIGESAKDKHLRYLKQIKARNTEEIYHAENVIVCQVAKPDNFLMFDFLSFGNEREHLKALSENDRSDLIQKVKDLSAAGESQRKISTELGISLGTVNNYLKK